MSFEDYWRKKQNEFSMGEVIGSGIKSGTAVAAAMYAGGGG